MKSALVILSALALANFLASGVVLALPSEISDDTPMVDGRVRAIAQVGGNVWVGGSFSHVERRDGAVPEDVNNVAVFDVETGRYLDIAPKLGDNGSTVWDMDVYGDAVIIAGDFPGPGTAENNLVVVDGATGEVTRWYDSPPVRSTLAAPELGRIYGGGRSLSAFDFRSAEKLWSRARVSMDQSLRPYEAGLGYRDLEIDPDGSTIWAACGCDAVGDDPAKALVKLDAEGNHDPSWVAEAEREAFGISVANQDGSIYLGAGGNDFLASYPRDDNGRQAWKRDTSGSWTTNWSWAGTSGRWPTGPETVAGTARRTTPQRSTLRTRTAPGTPTRTHPNPTISARRGTGWRPTPSGATWTRTGARCSKAGTAWRGPCIPRLPPTPTRPPAGSTSGGRTSR